MSSGLTKYVVCVKTEQLMLSQKIRQSMRFYNKPDVVNLDWFIDSLEACQLQPLDSKYLVDISPFQS